MGVVPCGRTRRQNRTTRRVGTLNLSSGPSNDSQGPQPGVGSGSSLPQHGRRIDAGTGASQLNVHEPGSPDSIFSTGSFATSVGCQTSFESNSSYRRRSLTPGTPTSSVLSSHEFHQQATQGHAFEAQTGVQSQFRSKEATSVEGRFSSEAVRFPFLLTSSAGAWTSPHLRGVWHVSSNIVEPPIVQNVLLGSHFRPNPSSLHRIEENPGPWTPNALRYGVSNTEWVIDSPELFARTQDSAHSPDTTNRKKARRHQQLTPGQRQKASHMRNMGACLRCCLYKESVWLFEFYTS